MAVSRSSLVRRWVRHALLCAVLVSAVPSAARAQSLPSCATPVAAGFENLAEGTEYVVGDTFTSGAATFVGRPFTWSDGRTTEDGFARVDPAQSMAGGTGIELQVNNILLAIGFGGPLNSVGLRFGEYGGNVNLEINGDPRNLDDLSKLSGTTVGGARVTVAPAEGETWTLRADGPIRTFAIGGQELWIDDVVGTPACPDLSIGDMSSGFAEQGRRFVVTVVVVNLGQVASRETVVTVSSDGWGVARQPVPQLEVGASTEVLLALAVPPGEHGRRVPFVVWVDPDDIVRETDEANNVETIPDVLVPTADLALTVESTTLSDDQLLIAVVARNQGGAASRPTTVGTAAEGWPTEDVELQRLQPGEEVAVSLELPIPADQHGRTVEFAVIADPNDLVRRELDESNNTAEFTVDVPIVGDDTSDPLDRNAWLPILLAAIALGIGLSFVAIRRIIRRSRRPRLPELSRLGLQLRAGEPDVRVAARPAGSPRHTVRVILRSDRAREQVRERTLR
jgi:CARDB